MIKFFL